MWTYLAVSSPTASPAPSIAALVAPYFEQDIDLLEKAAKKPVCVFDLGSEEDMETAWQRFSAARELSRRLGVVALVRARNGDQDAATRAIELSAKSVNDVVCNVSTISQLVQHATISLITSTVNGITAQSKLDYTHAKRIDAALATLNPKATLSDALKGERVYGILHFFKNQSGVNAFELANELAYLRLMQEAIDMSSVPYYTGKAQDFYNNPPLPAYAIAVKPIRGLVKDVRESTEVSAARLNGTRTALGLALYKSEFGAYPESLTEMRKKLDWPKLDDPFSGKDFIYKRDGDEFILYSIGPDLKDSGGSEFDRDSGTGDVVTCLM